MRTEYEVFQRLVWNAEFRRELARGNLGALQEAGLRCGDTAALVRLARSPGLEEEAYRRLASLYKTSAEVFRHAHSLIVPLLGPGFFERVLADYFAGHEDGPGTREILELFDGYVAGPRLRRAVHLATRDSDVRWLAGVADYDWAVWHALRVAGGWPPFEELPPLAPGASLVAVDFDLKALLREIRRLSRAAVSDGIFRERILPAPGAFRAVILPRDASVAEAVLDDGSYEELLASLGGDAGMLNPELRCAVEDLGIVVANSFLCCSSEMRARTGTLADAVIPDPH